MSKKVKEIISILKIFIKTMPSTCGAQTGKSSQRNYVTDFSAPMARLLIIEPITKASIKKGPAELARIVREPCAPYPDSIRPPRAIIINV